MFSLDTMRLNAYLRLPPLTRSPVCHGYSCGCVCEGCLEREQRPETAQAPPRQPWEAQAA